TAGADVPKGLALHLRHSLGCHCPRKLPAGSRHPAQIKGNTRNACHRIRLAHWPWTPTALSAVARQQTHARLMPDACRRDEGAVAAASPLFACGAPLVPLSVRLTMAGLMWLAVIALSPGGFGAVDLVLVALFAVTLPWYVIGFWNAPIGLLIMRFARDPVAAV